MTGENLFIPFPSPQSLRFLNPGISMWVIYDAIQGMEAVGILPVSIVNSSLIAPDNELQESSCLQTS